MSELHPFWHRAHKNRKNVILGVVTVILTIVMFFIANTEMFLTSVVMLSRSPSFTGTVMPISEIPDWNRISKKQRWQDKNTLPAEVFVKLPRYNISRLATDWSLLGNSSNDKQIRMEKITFTIPYLGTYKMDYKEYTGGHPGVDIITPPNTEIFAMANAVVYQSSFTSGAGNYVILRHDNVPDPDNPASMITLFSAYEHLSSRLVEKGDIVSKGQMIALSGSTGNSTAPHLHFQIDRANAPFHPYWPADFSDVEDPKSKTIHPIKYVYDYENFSDSVIVASSDTSTPSVNITTDTNNNPDPVINTGSSTVETTPTVALPDTRVTAFRITGDNSLKLGSTSLLRLEAIDASGQIISDYDDPVTLSIDGPGKLSKENLSKADFQAGVAELSFIPTSAGEATITASNTLASGLSKISVVAEIAQVTSFAIEVDDPTLELGVPKTIQIHALDSGKKLVTSASFPGNAIITTTPVAALSKSQISASDFKNGIAEIVVNPEQNGQLKLKVKSGVLVGSRTFQVSESKQIFSDVLKTHQNYPAIQFLYDRNIIKGYDDGTFRPTQTVSRSELVKIILLGVGKSIEAGTSADFSDVEASAWYAPYISKASELGVVNGYDDGSFKPAKVVSRIEALKIILEAMGKEMTEPSTAPYGDTPTGQWFSKYAEYAKNNKLIDVINNALQPSKGMTRAEVAEVMYRMMKI